MIIVHVRSGPSSGIGFVPRTTMLVFAAGIAGAGFVATDFWFGPDVGAFAGRQVIGFVLRKRFCSRAGGFGGS